MFLFLYLYLSLYSLRVDATCNVRIHTYLLFSSFYIFFFTVDRRCAHGPADFVYRLALLGGVGPMSGALGPM